MKDSVILKVSDEAFEAHFVLSKKSTKRWWRKLKLWVMKTGWVAVLIHKFISWL